MADGVMWLMYRLRAMGPGEILFRTRRFFRARARNLARQVLGQPPGGPARRPEAHEFMVRTGPVLPAPPLAIPPEDAIRLLGGEIPCHGTWMAVTDDPATCWRRDPLTGTLWPDGASGPIRYRPGNPHGDVRLVWEPNRLQHLVALARMAREQPQERDRACRLIESHLRSWLAGNPFPQGMNHLSAMEEALRLMAVAHAFDEARTWLSPDVREQVLQIMATHAWHIEGHLSLYSSAGNHTIAEAVGLLYAGTLLPEHPRGDRWRRLGRDLLRQEAPRQVRPDGGALEQSTWYLLFITELMELAAALLNHTGSAPVQEMDDARRRAWAFLGALAPSRQELPRIGDADDGHALSPWLDLPWPAQEPTPRFRQFPDTGITVVSFEDHDRLLFLHKDLGMPPNFGHGHGDALSLLFRWRGADVLLDPGTYLYGGPPELRQYFRSAAGHNTLTVQEADQALQTGPFMWRKPYKSRVILSTLGPDEAAILAAHDGYRDRGCMHWRGVCYRRGSVLVVWDYVEGRESPYPTVRWHIGGQVTETEPRGSYRITLPHGHEITLTMSPGPVAHHVASTQPRAGWQSTAYGSLTPCHTLALTPEGPDSQEILTVFSLSGGMEESGQNLVGEDMRSWLTRFRTLARHPR